MARWGQLNIALTAWRNAYVALFAKYGIHRGTDSDGALADSNHSSTSQHQQDSDGTVDANDMDVNVLGSSNPTGTPAERRVIEAMKLDFENDPHGRSQLWISYREIANRDVGDWRERGYTGASAHDHHVHWESRQAREDDGRAWPMPRTEAALRRELGLDDDVVDAAQEDRIAEKAAAKVWAAAGGSAEARETAFQRLGDVDARAEQLVAAVGQLTESVGQLVGKVDELLARVPDPTPAQRLDQ